MRPIPLKYVLPSVSIVSALGFALPAQAFDFKISGQIDRALVAADNGEDSDIGFVDNNGSNSRFRFTGEQKLNSGLTVGFAYEIGLGENSSASFDVNGGGGDNDDFLDDRLANVYVQGAFGKLTFGKVDGAANGTSQVDYSGTTFIGGGTDLNSQFGGISFLDDDGNALGTVGNVVNEFDGLSRQNAIRYDTPTFNGLTLSASIDNGHAYETAARYETPFGDGGKFGFAADYLDSQSQGRIINPGGEVVATGDRFQEYGGSASVLLPVGITFTGSYKHREYIDARDIGDSDSADNYFGSVGYLIGPHHFALSFERTDDLLNDGSEGNAAGFAYVFDWTKSIELYAAYHRLWLDDANEYNDDGGIVGNVDAQDLDVVFSGVRLKFL